MSPPPVTLTFDLESGVRVACVPILVFLGVSVLDLGPMYTTDRQTSDRQMSDRRQTASSLNAPPRMMGV